MAENAIAPFDLEKINESIRARIRLAFVEAIPDEAWNAMIRKEVDAFMQTRHVETGYGSHQVPSHFSDVVRSELTKELQVRIKQMLEGQEWQGHWNGNMQNAGERIKALMIENSGEILNSWIGNIFQNMMSDLRNRMQQR